jgi:hypothetical protein
MCLHAYGIAAGCAAAAARGYNTAAVSCMSSCAHLVHHALMQQCQQRLLAAQVGCSSTLSQAAAQCIGGEHLRHTGMMAETTQCARIALARTTRGSPSSR